MEPYQIKYRLNRALKNMKCSAIEHANWLQHPCTRELFRELGLRLESARRQAEGYAILAEMQHDALVANIRSGTVASIQKFVESSDSTSVDDSQR